jgi:copper chaperone CopZ
MKTVFIVLISILTYSAKAQQTTKTQTFTVKGNCEDCQKRIENAADIKGVKICTWNADTKVATATFDTTKTSLLKIQEAIAASGYDAGTVKASAKAYSKLPACCKYNEGKCEESKK